MKVFVTGATGFVGAHSARELLDAGHEVRLLVRSERGVREYFARYGHAVDDLVIGDMRDAARVEASMRGCNAVLHAAALVSVDPRRGDEIYRNNVAGIDAVIGTACRLGIGRIVYVSSLSVLFQKDVSAITEAVPLGNPTEAYARSKRDCDVHVRTMQARGMPIRITYPAGIIGPDDPRLSEANHGFTAFVKFVPQTSSGVQFIDVRDLAVAHRHLLERGAGGDPESWRYIVAGRYHPWAEFRRVLEGLTGRSIAGPRLPAPLMRGLGSATDAVRKLIPFATQVSREAMGYVTEWVPADSSRLLAATGMRFRPPEETYADAIRWLVKAGHLDRKYAGAVVKG